MPTAGARFALPFGVKLSGRRTADQESNEVHPMAGPLERLSAGADFRANLCGKRGSIDERGGHSRKYMKVCGGGRNWTVRRMSFAGILPARAVPPLGQPRDLAGATLAPCPGAG